MVMISPCAGCDASILAHVLAILEAISGLITIFKSTWWWWWFKIPTIASSAQRADNIETEDEHNNDNHFRVNVEHSHPLDDTVSTASEDCEENANNVLWMLTGVTMGVTNITLAVFLLIGLTSVNYIIIITWCLTFPLYYIIDCILLTLLLKHCTSKERFDRCRTDYIYSTICTFIFHSYVLWVAISVIHWCNCRRDPYRCRFNRDYCHSFHLNFSSDPFRTSGMKNEMSMMF